MDGEEANDRIVETVYSEKDFLEICNKSVPIIASTGSHKPVEGPDGRQVCSRFGHVTCSDHRRLEKAVHAHNWTQEGVRTPSHIVVKPDGTEVSRLIDVHTINAYMGMVRGASSDLGKGLTADEYKTARDALDAAVLAARNGDLNGLRSNLESVLTLVSAGPLKESVDQLFKKLDELGGAVSKKASDLQAKGQHLEACELLRDGLRGLKLRPAEISLKEAFAALKSTKEGKAADALLERADKLRPQFEKLAAAEDNPKLSATLNTYFDILLQVPDTRLAKEVRARIAAIQATAKEPIAKLIDDEEAELLWKQAARIQKSEPERSRELMKQILDQYPKSPSARRASKVLGSTPEA
jgi:hypothetical protein